MRIYLPLRTGKLSTLELPSASIDVFSISKLCNLKHRVYFLLKLFDIYFLVDAHNLLKFQKISVIHHRNKLVPTYTLQSVSFDAVANVMLKRVTDATVLRLLWKISLEYHLFCLTRLLWSFCEIMASFT